MSGPPCNYMLHTTNPSLRDSAMHWTEAIAGRRVRMSALAAVAWIGGAATTPAMAIPVMRPTRSHAPGLSRPDDEFIAGVRANRVVAPASLYSALAKLKKNVPGYSQQTGLACSSCHYQFPQLTPFGRLFKLNGYTLTGLQSIGQPGDSAGKQSLKLSPIPEFSSMLLTSLTRTRKALPNTQNSTAAFPQQLSVFVSGAVTPKIGLFSQITYAGDAGAIGIDNIDLRYADHATLAGRDLLYGFTMNNNPTVQDVWNTVPAWGSPFVGSPSALSPITSTLIDGALGQQVVGLGAYSLYANRLYTEFTVYRSAPQGAAVPLDSTARNTTAGVIPYWRVALQHETPTTSLMLGTFGFDAHLYPEGVSGLLNHYSDVAVDAQVERRQGEATWIGRASIIHERQQLSATQSTGGADNVTQRLTTSRINIAYLPSREYGLTLGYFQTTGTADTTLYAPQALVGSRSGLPNTVGAFGEINFNPWQNTRVGLQYTAYSKFNGASSAYDVAGGRNASDNNTLYLFLWLAM